MDPVVGAAVVVLGGAVLVYRFGSHRDGIPFAWRTSQSTAARLHRRMHRSVDATSAALRRAERRGQPVDHYRPLLDDLRACAAVVDGRLLVASRLSLTSRHKTLLTLRYRVVDLEKAALRIATMIGEAGRPDLGAARRSLADLHSHLDHLEQARGELRDLGGT